MEQTLYAQKRIELHDPEQTDRAGFRENSSSDVYGGTNPGADGYI